MVPLARPEAFAPPLRAVAGFSPDSRCTQRGNNVPSTATPQTPTKGAQSRARDDAWFTLQRETGDVDSSRQKASSLSRLTNPKRAQLLLRLTKLRSRHQKQMTRLKSGI